MVDTVHYDIATTKILAAGPYYSAFNSHPDSYYKNNMIASAHYYLDLISDIQGKTVDYKSFTDNDIKLNIHIKDLKFHHSYFLIYADTLVLNYIKDYIKEQVKVYNENCIHLIDYTRQGWVSGNGWGTAILVQYEPHLEKKIDESLGNQESVK